MKLKQLILLLFLPAMLQAAQPFIRSIDDPGYGNDIRVCQSGNGWAVFSLDSLKLSKFSACGVFEWGKKYSLPNQSPGLRDFIGTHDGGFAIMTRLQTGSSMFVSVITKIDSSGNITWCKSYQDPVYSQFPYTINEDANGNLYLFMNVENVNDNSIYNLFTKLGSNGNVIWGKLYDHGWVWGSSIITSDNGFLLRTGSNLIKVDASGNEQWNSQVLGSGYYYIAPAEVADGYIFTGYTSGNQRVIFSKVSKSGTVMLGGCRRTNLTGNPGRIYSLQNGNIAGVFQQAGSSSTLVELDKDLNVVRSTAIGASSGAGLFGRDVSLEGNAPVLAGVAGGSPFFASLGTQSGTDCDLPFTLTHTVIALQQQFQATSVTGHLLNIVPMTFPSADFSVSTSPICHVPALLDLGNDTSICGEFRLTLEDKAGETFESWRWSTGESTPSINVQQGGNYQLEVTLNCGQDTLEDSILVTKLTAADAGLGNDRFLCEGEDILLQAPACDSCIYSWNDGSTQPSMHVEEPGMFWLTVSRSNGCADSDTILVNESKCQCSLFLPSAFTPNHDGRNDTFVPIAYCDLLDFSLRIFNRWGELVFETDNISSGWNGYHRGSPAATGLYPYLLSYTPMIGGLPGNQVVKKGSVTILY